MVSSFIMQYYGKCKNIPPKIISTQPTHRHITAVILKSSPDETLTQEILSMFRVL